MKIRMTAKAVEALAAKATRQEIPDAAMPGLYCVVQPSGAKSWAYRYRIDGKTRKATLGQFPALSLAEARDAARTAARSVERNVDPLEAARAVREAEAERRSNTLAAVAAEFIDRHAKRNNRSWKETESTLKRHVLSRLGEKPVDAVRRRDIHAIMDNLVDAGEPYAAVKVLAAVRRLYNWAMEREIIEANPAARIKAPVKMKPRTRVLDDGEIRALWARCLEAAYPFGDFARVLLLSGCRRNEIADLQWPDIDLGASVITIPRERYKNGLAHVVPLSAAARDVVKTLPQFTGGSYVFSTCGGARPISGFSALKARLDRGLASPIDYDLHDLRRTCRTGLSRLRIEPHIAERVLGHTQRGVATHYDHWAYLDEKRDALEAWGRHVEAIVGGAPADNVVSLHG